jgi:hypothetical protein
MKLLKNLIFNYPSIKLSVKHPNKKPRIHNFTIDGVVSTAGLAFVGHDRAPCWLIQRQQA